MAKIISVAKSLNNLPLADGGLKLSENILLNKIEKHPKFQELFPIDESLLDRITQNIKEKGFDNSQPVHIWKTKDEEGTEHLYLIDGYTRYQAAMKAQLESVPYYKHTFENFDEAYKYALHMQIDRRQLNDSDFMKNLRELMGSKYMENYSGNKAQYIADNLQVSTKTAKRALNVEKYATEEQKERIENGSASINQIYKENHPKKEKQNTEAENDKNEREEVKNTEDDNPFDIGTAENIDGDEDATEAQEEVKDNEVERDNPTHSNRSYSGTVSNALKEGSESEGNPAGLNFNHSDGIERPVKLRDDSDKTDRWLIEKNKQVESARNEGFAKGFETALYFTLAQIEKGKSVKEVLFDEKVADLSVAVISNFVLSTEDEEIINRLKEEE